MTRRLPWKRTGAADVRTSPTAQEPTRPRDSNDAVVSPSTPRAAAAPGSGPSASAGRRGVDRGDEDAERTVAMLLDADRGGSTSPPPEPLSERYMIDGPENDDQWRMVEDELLATAQRFTAHLHAAEYQRLKSASRSRNASTIQNISRPVVGRMTDLVRLKQERKARAARVLAEKRRRKAREGGMDHNSDDDSESAGDVAYGSTSLFGLMERPRRTASLLDPAAPPVGATTAAATTSAREHPAVTSPMLRRVSPHAPRPTFSSIPGLHKKYGRAGKRIKAEEVIAIDDETTSSEEDLDWPQFQSDHSPTAERGRPEHIRSTARAGYVARPSDPTGTASDDHGHRPGTRKSPTTASTSKRQERAAITKSASDNNDDDDDDDDILARLKKRRAQATRDKRRSSAGPGHLDVG